MGVIIQLYLVPKQPIRGDLLSLTPITDKPSDLPSSAPAITETPSDFESPTPVITEKPSNVDRPYHVFINHWGLDVKLTLASIISHRLRDKGFRLFLNRRENEPAEDVGCKIRHAIDSALVHIAIFSKTYVESSSCLNELCLMLETDAKLIPIFFDVKPSDLRRIDGKSVYSDAFARWENDGGHNPQKLEEWETALEKVSNTLSLELEGQSFKGNWGHLLETIVKDVDEAFIARRGEKASQIGFPAKIQRESSE